uniref:hydroxymethylbilane synthase n=1 Tax=Dermatophagoides pteronyssinus TaxID=6956 RepID=A0A6P6XV89_DERPT|nr:uncharacterized protein LOC113791608 [Dermatophagoides pteronyssinus]
MSSEITISFEKSVEAPTLLTIGSRKSRLAMIQTHMVIDALKHHYPKCEFVVKNIDTTGDNILDRPLAKIGEKALFTRELEEELLKGTIDIIVHSLKDMPTTLPDRCCIGAIMQREDPSDSLVLREDLIHLNKTEQNMNIKYIIDDCTQHVQTFGTSSLRRIAQLRNLSQNVSIKDVRGNLNTRLDKLDNHPKYGYDCLILATAGLKRAGFNDRISLRLTDDNWYHAVSQGALGIECLADDYRMQRILHPLVNPRAVFECTSERVLMKCLEGGCSVPIGVQTEWSNNERWLLTLKAKVLSTDGKQSVQGEQTEDLDNQNVPINETFELSDFTDIRISETDNQFECRLQNSVRLGRSVAKKLIDMGVKDILKRS